MSFVDDIVDVNIFGKQTIEMNEYTSTEISKRRLQMSHDKCVRIHVKHKRNSKDKENTKECEKLEIDGWIVKKVKSSNG